MNGSNEIQAISSVALAFDSSTIVLDQTLFTVDFTAAASTGRLATIDSTNWFDGEEVATSFVTTVPATSGKQMQVNDQDGIRVVSGDTNSTTNHAALVSTVDTGSLYALQSTVRLRRVIGSSPTGGLLFRAASGATGHFTVEFTPHSSTVGDFKVQIRKLENGVGDQTVAESGFFTLTGSGTFTDSQELEVHVNGNTVTVFVNSVQQVQGSMSTSFNSNTKAGVGARLSVTSRDDILFENFTILSGLVPASRRTVKLVVASGGNVYAGTKTAGLVLAGTGSLTSGEEVSMESAFQQMYMTDGLVYRILNPNTNVVTNWGTSITDGSIPVGGTGTAYTITAVSAGAGGTFTVAEDLSSILSATDFIEVLNSPANDRTYTVASTSGSGPTVVTVNETIPDGTAGGTLALGDVTCRFVVLYNGRLWMAGLETDPSNWFASAFEDALNFDYGATADGTQAVAGNTNQAGKLEDIITALMPYLDDVLYFGGDHTIWVLQGDPALDGRIDNVSRQLGIVGPQAFSFDSTANMYFLAQNGLYKLRSGTTSIESISKGRLDDTLSQLNFAENRIRLQYDREWQGVHIFITPTSEPSTSPSHYFWDERSDSFWRDTYPTNMGPTAVHLFDSDDFDDRAVLLGGFDSFIRFFDRTSKSDDGTAIDSFINFTSMVAGDRNNITISEIQVNLAEGSDGNAILKVFAASSAENAAAETVPKAAKALSEGRNQPLLARVTGNTIIIQIRDTTLASTWAYENGSFIVDGGGIVRKEESS